MKTGYVVLLGMVALSGCHSNYSTTGTTPNPTPTVTPLPTPWPTVCPAWGCGPAPIHTVIVSDSSPGETKDTDLQQAEVEQDTIESRAGSIAEQFQMNYQSAVQLAALADHVQQLTSTNSLTADDREAIAGAALGIAGITSDEVNTATVKSLKGDQTGVDDLVTKAALNLGMPSSANLRDKLLPSLGVDLKN